MGPLIARMNTNIYILSALSGRVPVGCKRVPLGANAGNHIKTCAFCKVCAGCPTGASGRHPQNCKKPHAAILAAIPGRHLAPIYDNAFGITIRQ